MGLDITAYRKLSPSPTQGFDSDGEPMDENAIRLYGNDDFPGRADDVSSGTSYRFDDEFDFRAGSYGGYNDWRDKLAQLAGYSKGTGSPDYRCRFAQGAFEASSGPFWELINFADNEGVIGSAISKKLAADFAEFQSRADDFADARFRDLFADWRKAFEMASDSGAVSFH